MGSSIISNNDSPFNPNNKLINLSTLVNLLSVHGIKKRPIDISIYRKSLLHKSYCTRKNENFISGNTDCPLNCIPLANRFQTTLEPIYYRSLSYSSVPQ